MSAKKCKSPEGVTVEISDLLLFEDKLCQEIVYSTTQVKQQHHMWYECSSSSSGGVVYIESVYQRRGIYIGPSYCNGLRDSFVRTLGVLLQ